MLKFQANRSSIRYIQQGSNQQKHFMPFKMKNNVFFCLLFVAYTKGNTETECAEAEEKFIKCKFSKNINITKTDFSAYFYPVYGHEELLVDCVWMGDQLHCIEQEGVHCKQPVSDFAAISIPARVANRNGTYRCVDEGSHLENSRPCQFIENTDVKVPNMQTSSTHLTLLKESKRNLTVKLKERYEMYFSFPDAVKDDREKVYVQHKKPDSVKFNTKCIIQRSREGCTSTTELCRCPSQTFGNFSLNKVFDEEDSGVWLFSLWTNGTESTMSFNIIVEGNATKRDPDSTLGSKWLSTTLGAILTVVIIVIFITVVLCCYKYKKASRTSEERKQLWDHKHVE